jgi:hypothetical protein
MLPMLRVRVRGACARVRVRVRYECSKMSERSHDQLLNLWQA